MGNWGTSYGADISFDRSWTSGPGNLFVPNDGLSFPRTKKSNYYVCRQSIIGNPVSSVHQILLSKAKLTLNGKRKSNVIRKLTYWHYRRTIRSSLPLYMVNVIFFYWSNSIKINKIEMRVVISSPLQKNLSPWKIMNIKKRVPIGYSGNQELVASPINMHQV